MGDPLEEEFEVVTLEQSLMVIAVSIVREKLTRRLRPYLGHCSYPYTSIHPSIYYFIHPYPMFYVSINSS